jgi:cytochrome c-type biogenesis protein CcmH/NrfG
MNRSALGRRLLVAALVVVLVAGGVAVYFLWLRPTSLPGPDSPVYKEYLRAFQVGVAALDTGEQDKLARTKLEQAAKLIPGEPAAWANLGLLDLRNNDLKEAARNLEKARKLAPDNGEIEALLGYLAREQGRLPEAVAHFRKAVEKDPRDTTSLYTLATAVSEEGGPDSNAEYLRLMDQILKVQPNNLKALAEKAGAALRSDNKAAFRSTLERLTSLAPSWSRAARDKLAEVRRAAKGPAEDLVPLVVQLDNVLKPEHGYNRSSLALEPKRGFVGAPLEDFLILPRARSTPAAPDRELTFTLAPGAAAQAAVKVDQARWDILGVLWRISPEERRVLSAEARSAKSGGIQVRPGGSFEAAIIVANAHEVRRADAASAPLTFPGGQKEIAPSMVGVLAVDWDNDLRNDLLLAGAGGLRFYHQEVDGTFKDVTKTTGLADAILQGDYYGAWAADLDTDGDLDFIVARRAGPPLVLRNNGDGTFTAQERFTSVKGARAFVWADLDNDGMPDAAFLDAAGQLHVFANERAGQFEPWPLPANLGTFLALAAADVNDDGVLDLLAVKADGALMRVSDKDHRASWDVAELARGMVAKSAAPGTIRLFAEDLDNNGATDLVVAGPREAQVFLADEGFHYAALPATVPGQVSAVLDLDQDGRLDFVMLSREGRPARAVNHGGKDYRWQEIPIVGNPSAKGDAQNRDKRINSFGIGGEGEIRSGALVQKRPMNGAPLHFGLGEHGGMDVARFVWPNGLPQWEFEMAEGEQAPPNRVVRVLQRLSGSCPFLFAHDGRGMAFVVDFMWATPLGMHVNGQDQGDFLQTTEWVKIRGDQLVPRNGYYDVRVHANLWETDYFDELALIVVDHPPGTDIYADERFFLTPTPPKLYVTTPARPVARAWDHHGKDATELVSKIDGRYLDRAGRGPYQGVTEDHWIEADLGEDAPHDGPVYLIARGWLQPTDSSINVALEQGKHDRPRGLVLEIPDGTGGWKVGRDRLGFPAGKNKTILIRLDGIDGKGVSRRFRLRTNMEVYWDFLGYARGLDPKLARLQRPAPAAADLRYRGLLAMTRRDASSPELPHYDQVLRGQRWRDLTGYYTRYGDVRQLLAKVDDRFVIMNAGDEIALRFPVPEPPPPGWQRDFLWESDGWTRDGNPNTRFGTTVLPLPAHGGKMSDRPPGRLEDDPVYQRFPQDWVTYHTRYVTPDEFARGLRTFRRRAEQR